MFWLGVEDDAQLHQATLTPNEGVIQRGIDALTSFITYRKAKQEETNRDRTYQRRSFNRHRYPVYRRGDD